jgi:hydroxylamine reductase
LEAIFATLTNVDFDRARFDRLIRRAVEVRDAVRNRVGDNADWPTYVPAALVPEESLQALSQQGVDLDFVPELDPDPDIRSLKQTLLYGMKGVAAYAHHAWMLGRRDDAITGFLYESLVALLQPGWTVQDGLDWILRTGQINLRTMELLDAAHCDTFGHPEPVSVSLGIRAGKAILVSGHDLHDLSLLLAQTAGTGISIYTHGEMLPAHGYPGLRNHPHLAGHFGTAWQNQHQELPLFPGPVLFTTNCIQRPDESYRDRVFSTGLVGWPGCPHIANKDFSPMIRLAEAMEGFPADQPGGSVTVGFGHQAVLGRAAQIVDAVNDGSIRHFFLVGGCDGAKPGRDYFTRFVEETPEDCVILTLACGKFRFFDKPLGEINGIPRLLDVGQCNDAYSAIRIAYALASALGCDVNELPLSFIFSWYEQKAVAVLLTLLYLGIQDIRLGPTLPAFLSPAVLDVLRERFRLRSVASSPQKDLAEILNRA